MNPQFQRVVTLTVMSILVGLFAWIYLSDRQRRARLWMIGWACIVVHFAGMLLFSFGLIPSRLADWSAYATLILAAAAFFLSVRRAPCSRLAQVVFWAAIVAPALGYWTGMVFEVQNPAIYRAIVAVELGASLWFALREYQQATGTLLVWLLTAVVPGVWAMSRAPGHPESGIDYILFQAFAVTGWRYWRYFRRFTPGVVLTSLAFLAWGLVFPIAELCAALQVNIPGDHVVWDLPKYFVAFGMIMTLFENQTVILQVEIAERKRAEETAKAANEAKSILMASTSFVARRFLGAEGWQTVIPEALSKIGVAARVSRVYVAQVLPAGRILATTILHEWCGAGQPNGFPRSHRNFQGPDWKAHTESLRRGELVSLLAVQSHADEAGEAGPKSSILVPIEVSGVWFGFLAFEDQRREREWTEAERDAFRSAARMLGASMTRQRAQEYVDNILRSMDESLLVMDDQLQIKRVNPSALRMLGYAEEELIGRPARQVILEREVPIRRSAVERTYRTKSGRSIPVLFSSAEMRNGAGALEGYVWLAQDMTELKRVQRELVRAKDAAEEANRAKSAFLANMSHELRTPLNAVIGYSEMLQEVVEDRGEDDLVPDLTRIRSAGQHLLGLINDVLDLAKIEAGKVELCIEKLGVLSVIHDAICTIHPLVEQNGNRLEVECQERLGAVLADQTRVRQVLFNLLSNACKFTSNGLIRLEAKGLVQDGSEWVEFRVSDTGIGMSPKQMDRLYRPFMQADASTTRKFGGTGLGLTISRDYCHLMGGSLTGESELGKGSVFTVRLPGDASAEQFPDMPGNLVADREGQIVHA
ncbi:MAG TPA: ATP-binding protein [Bryobacteraceae bacterium]|nr:ATP-binding protein [Bryobacteraceae bacterium]